jgi:hypothetical protein
MAADEPPGLLSSWLGEHHVSRLKAASREWVAHTLTACVLLLGIWTVEQWLYLLWRGNDPILFGWFPFRYIFHAADAAVIGCFLFFGGFRTIRIYMA